MPHGGNWIVTYADMITLLMAGFIIIVTFANRDVNENMIKKTDTIWGGQGGTGIAGQLRKSAEKDSVTVRKDLGRGNPFAQGSRTPPSYVDSPMDVTKNIRKLLDEERLGDLGDSYEIGLPYGVLFESPNQLSAVGKLELQRIAMQFRPLPYDVIARVGPAEDIGRALLVQKFFMEEAFIHPVRTGISLAPSKESGTLYLWMRRLTPNGD